MIRTNRNLGVVQVRFAKKNQQTLPESQKENGKKKTKTKLLRFYFEIVAPGGLWGKL